MITDSRDFKDYTRFWKILSIKFTPVTKEWKKLNEPKKMYPMNEGLPDEISSTQKKNGLQFHSW